MLTKYVHNTSWTFSCGQKKGRKKEKEKKFVLFCNNVADLCLCSMTFQKSGSIYSQVHTFLHIMQYVFVWKYCVAITCLKWNLCQDLQDFVLNRCMCMYLIDCLFVCLFICVHVHICCHNINNKMTLKGMTNTWNVYPM